MQYYGQKKQMNSNVPITAQGPGMNSNMWQWRTEEFNSSKLFQLVIIEIQYEMLHRAGTCLQA